MFSQTFHERVGALLLLDSMVYAGGGVGSCDQSALFAISPSGELALKEVAAGVDFGSNALDDLKFRAADSVLIASAAIDQGDVVPVEGSGSFVLGFSVSGELLFKKNLEQGVYGPTVGGGSPVYLSPFWGDGIALANPQYLLKLDNVGEYVEPLYGLDTFEEQFQGVDVFQDSLLVAHTKGRLLLMDQAGVFLDSIFPEGGIRDVHVGDSLVFILGSGQIIAYEPILKTLSYESGYISQISQPEGLAGNGDYLFVYEKSAWNEGGASILRLGLPDLSFVDATLFEAEHSSITDVVAGDESLYILGNKQIPNISLNISLNIPFLKTIPILAPPVFQEDISMSDFEILTEVQVLQVPFSPGNYYIDGSNPVQFQYTITNNGTDTLRSFCLSTHIFGGFNCSLGLHYDYHENVSVPPGESQLFQETFSPSIPNVQLGATYSVRFAAFAPNHHLDQYNDDNIATVDVTVTATEDIVEGISTFEIYPNPSRGILSIHVESREGIGESELCIITMDGRITRRWNIPSTGRILDKQLNARGLPTGVYYLRLLTSRGFLMEKIMIAE